jgi:diketogulonate reductase-like aldo/keto reductase
MITNKSQIHPIAIGTYGLGADRTEMWKENKEASTSTKDKELTALLTAFEAGQNYIETSFIYAGGETMKFLATFFKLIPRDKIFITVKLEKFIEKKEDIEMQLDKYFALMELDYADALILHAPSISKLPLQETYKAMNEMVVKGKARYLSGSNLSLEQLKSIHEDSGIKLFSVETLYNLECKINEDTGFLKYCEDNDIMIACYQPLRRNRTAQHNFPVLTQLAEKYNKTQNQILINWIVKRKKLTPLIKASSAEHVRENLESLDFEIEEKDMKKLDSFRSQEFDAIANQIDWEDKDNGIPIYKFANQCE